jgi:hypothetical protein
MYGLAGQVAVTGEPAEGDVNAAGMRTCRESQEELARRASLVDAWQSLARAHPQPNKSNFPGMLN